MKCFVLEVPPDLSYNYCMMNMKEEAYWKMTINESVSNLFWDFRDGFEDEGAEALKEECEKLEKVLMKLVKKYDVGE
jgi:hypothetical protein